MIVKGPMRALVGSALALACLGSGPLSCASVGHHVVPVGASSAAIPSAGAADAVDAITSAGARRHDMVILVVVDGLRRDTLTHHLKLIEDDDQEPPWPSGLALLRQKGFTFGYSDRMEAPIPAYGLAPLATIFTGQQPGAHGIPGSAFVEAGPEGSLRVFDFEAPAHSARVFYTLNGGFPDVGRPLLGGMLRGPTLMERLAPTHTSTVIFTPFGAGARWLIPDQADIGTRSMLRDRRAASVMPLVDRGAREAAVEMALGEEGPLPALWVLHFGTVMAESCFQEDELCSGSAGDLLKVQAEAMRAVDHHLWRVMRALSRAHPERMGELSVVLTGTGGVLDRTAAEAEAPRPASADVAIADLGAQLASWSTDEGCKAWLPAALASGELVAVAQGGSAQLYLPQRPLGSRLGVVKGRRCLGAALEEAVDQAPWLAGAAWLNGEGGTQVKLSSIQRGRTAAYRRVSLPAKIKAAMDTAKARRTGDAMIFANPPWRFSDTWVRARSPYAYQGPLDDAAIRVPFLVASTAMPAMVANDLNVTALELTDVVPTVLALLRAPETAYAGLERPPVLKWRVDPVAGDQLDIVRADRQIRGRVASLEARAKPFWHITEEGLAFGVTEGADLREPDSVDLRLGDDHWRWTYDDGFPEGAPCTIARGETIRRWTCRLPRPDATGLSTWAVRRDPSSDEDADGVEDFVSPIFWSPDPKGSQLSDVGAIAAQCAGPDHVELIGEGLQDPRLTSIRVALIPPGLPEGVIFGDAAATVTLKRPHLPDGCAAATDTGCDHAWQIAKGVSPGGPLHIPLSVSHLDHLEDTLHHSPVSSSTLKAFRDRYAALAGPGAQPPKAIWLALDLCGADGACLRRPLMSDVDYRKALSAPCEDQQP